MSTPSTLKCCLLLTMTWIVIQLAASPAFASTVDLAWDRNSEPTVIGYKVYHGTSSRNYQTRDDAGNNTSYTANGLSPGTYYFAVTAYDALGNESGFSDEVSATLNCTYTISQTAQSFTSSEVMGNVIVDALNGCAWTAVSNVVWITVHSGSSGSGGGSVTFSVAANLDSNSRTGTMTIAGQTFTVTQAGLTCTYSINPTSQFFVASGGSGSVAVTSTASCTWSAANYSPWISIITGAGGSGNGVLTYSVDPNRNDGQRMGTITIAGQTLLVTQDGLSGLLFTDVPADYWAYGYIAKVFQAGIANGCGSSVYCPDGPVTRQEMAAFIIKAVERDYGNAYCASGSPFLDVSPANTFCGDIKRLSELRITLVQGDFMPLEPVTRGQIAAFMMRALFGETFSYTTTPFFSDVPPEHGFFKYVQKMKDLGLTQLDGIYYVDRNLTLAEMAAFMARAFFALR